MLTLDCVFSTEQPSESNNFFIFTREASSTMFDYFKQLSDGVLLYLQYKSM